MDLSSQDTIGDFPMGSVASDWESGKLGPEQLGEGYGAGGSGVGNSQVKRNPVGG